MKTLTFSATIALAALLALQGCSDRPSIEPRPTLQPPDAAAEVEDEEGVEEQEEVEREPQYTYSPVGKRDPFRSPLVDVVGADDRDDEERLTALQRWDLDQLTVRAIVSATANPVAMVLDPEGHGHMVRRGALIGRNWGRVAAIRRDCLVITEQRRDATGAPMAVQQERCLPRDERDVRFEEQMRRQIQ